VDDGPPIVGQVAMILNVRYYGGYFVFSDRARLDSGCFEVVVIPDGGVPTLFRYALSALFRRMRYCRDIVCFRGRRVRIESEKPVFVQVDGDYFGTTPVDVQLVPASVAVVAPR